MREQQDQRRPESENRPDPRRHLETAGCEDLLVRNYDHRWGYDLAIEAVDETGRNVFEDRYYLQPLQVESEDGVLPPGDYEIRVTMDNLQDDELRCRIDADPDHTAVIEVGNSALSLTQGIRS